MYKMTIVITFRYLVRSYVTNPTTIRAITEIPAKTPRPIGRTDNFFPGSWNAPVDAADVPELAAPGDDVPDDEELGGVVVELVLEDNGVAVGLGVTVDKPWKGFDMYKSRRNAWNVH
jgi:hypothetical protein